MKIFLILLFIFSITKTFANPLKHENEGCADNSNCSKATGAKRAKWLKIIKDFSESKINETEANQEILKNSGVPIPIWANSTADINKENVILWDSPCAQHRAPNPKVFIGDVFVSNLSDKAVTSNPSIIFPKIIVKDNKKITSYTLPRGDAPINILNNSFYYTKEDEGIFYGMNIGFNGTIRIIKPKHISKFPKEVECPKELSEEFFRKAPALNFYKGHFCKEIWNQDQNSYSTIAIGWSCN